MLSNRAASWPNSKLSSSVIPQRIAITPPRSAGSLVVPPAAAGQQRRAGREFVTRYQTSPRRCHGPASAAAVGLPASSAAAADSTSHRAAGGKATTARRVRPQPAASTACPSRPPWASPPGWPVGSVRWPWSPAAVVCVFASPSLPPTSETQPRGPARLTGHHRPGPPAVAAGRYPVRQDAIGHRRGPRPGSRHGLGLQVRLACHGVAFPQFGCQSPQSLTRGRRRAAGRTMPAARQGLPSLQATAHRAGLGVDDLQAGRVAAVARRGNRTEAGFPPRVCAVSTPQGPSTADRLCPFRKRAGVKKYTLWVVAASLAPGVAADVRHRGPFRADDCCLPLPCRRAGVVLFVVC